MKEQHAMKPPVRWKAGKLFFSAEAERRVCFVLTLVMLLYGAVTWVTGG
ncbi:hypothetical protein [Desulfoluna spongiiphila]|uniref:Uncharacterized protein n=1 Tax=Desulfoluna spongiiphila TaxID=419481 RepID=A0A1G5IVA0_9BACT|nr:hypothetical protein [Desulfoluna spongiiphila]SCY79631.1 hypothetical protein SAMN05216233_12225 [Desulfoluna spongiiphila]VVS93361.1 hypothetical protein DBB_29290 [Desulfoluna spongiiphila]